MIAVDTNLLIYAHRADSSWHRQALMKLQRLSESGSGWAIPWPCIHEFLATVTKPVFRPPTAIGDAIAAIEAWLSNPGRAVAIGETSGHLEMLRKICVRGRIVGGAVHDSRIAAICIANGVTELWSADRDFSRFPDLKVVNPLVR